MYQKCHSTGGFAICRPRGRCDTIRDIVIAQKLVEHHPLGVIIKEYVIGKNHAGVQPALPVCAAHGRAYHQWARDGER